MTPIRRFLAPATGADDHAPHVLRLGDQGMVLSDEQSMVQLGVALAAALRGTEYVALYGPLGAGKTTLARAFLRAAGHAGAVRSPTFTLVEPYDLQAFTVLHLDLYRLAAAEELEWLGVRERFGDVVLLIEWPERGQGWLPVADLELRLDFNFSGDCERLSELDSRVVSATARTGLGEQALLRLLAAVDQMPMKNPT